MRSQMEQELFRALSNRTRSKPNDIYAKMSSQITALQDQVLLFNQLENQVPQWLRRETNKLGGEPRALSLKAMTQPKYDGLLAHCQLPQGDQNSNNTKLARKFSQKAPRDPRNSSYGSTAKSFNALLRSRQPNAVSKFWGKAESRVKDSTMIQTLPQDSGAGRAEQEREGKKEFNISVTESILFPQPERGREAAVGASRSRPASLREQIVRKQRVLWSEWEKTERYHQKLGQWMGEAEADRLLHTICNNSRVGGVIQKVRSTRPDSCNPLAKRHRIKSEQL